MQEAAVLHTIFSLLARSGKIFCQRLNSSGKQRNALKIALKNLNQGSIESHLILFAF